MRDPERIPEILSTIERIWKKDPEFRLGQLILIASKPTDPCPKIFYIEDDKLLEGLLEYEKRKEKSG